MMIGSADTLENKDWQLRRFNVDGGRTDLEYHSRKEGESDGSERNVCASDVYAWYVIVSIFGYALFKLWTGSVDQEDQFEAFVRFPPTQYVCFKETNHVINLVGEIQEEHGYLR